jgi:hypothetical protein
MPKPIQGVAGSGMHTHQSLFRGTENAFHDADAENQLSLVALQYIEGLLQHARGSCAITNPLEETVRNTIRAADVMMGHDTNCLAWLRAQRAGAKTEGGAAAERAARRERRRAERGE